MPSTAFADDHSDARALLGRADLAGAGVLIERLLDADPFDVDARLLEADWLRQRGELREARQRLLLLAADHPQRPEPLNNLAALAVLTGQHDEARSWLEKALATSPAYQSIYRNLMAVNAHVAAAAYAELLNIDAAAGEDLRLQTLPNAARANAQQTAVQDP